MRLRILTLLLLLTSMTWAQMIHKHADSVTLTMTGNIYNVQDSVGSASNIAACTNSVGCWHNIASSPSNMVQTGASFDLTGVLFVDGSHTIWKFDQIAGTFTGQTSLGTSMQSVGYAGAAGLWGMLASPGGGCNTGYFGLRQWNGSSWVQQGGGGCGTILVVDKRAYPYTLGQDGQVWTYQSSWTSPFPHLPTGTPTGLGVTPDGITVAVVVSGKVYSSTWSGSSWGAWVAIGGNIGARAVLPVFDTNLNVMTYYAGIPDAQYTNVQVWDGAKWDALGVAAAVPGMSLAFDGAKVYTAGGASGLAGRFSPTALVWTHSFQEHTSCNPSPCPNTTHTYHSTVTFGGNAVSGYSTGPATQDGSNFVTASFDPFSDPQPGDGSSDGVDCPVAGPNFVTAAAHIQYESAVTKVKATSENGTNCSKGPGGTMFCDYPTTSWCINTESPDWNPTSIRDSEWWPYWEGLNECIRRGTSGPWHCIPDFVIFGTVDPTAIQCTYNP